LEKKIRESEDKNRKLERTLKDNSERIIDVEREVLYPSDVDYVLPLHVLPFDFCK